jgi:hypothetical protein
VRRCGFDMTPNHDFLMDWGMLFGRGNGWKECGKFVYHGCRHTVKIFVASGLFC